MPDADTQWFTIDLGGFSVYHSEDAERLSAPHEFRVELVRHSVFQDLSVYIY